MNILVIAEHDNKTLKPSTLNTVGAAKALGGEIHVLVAGADCDVVAGAAAAVEGISKVIKADAAELEHPLAENHGALIADLAHHDFASTLRKIGPGLPAGLPITPWGQWR